MYYEAMSRGKKFRTAIIGFGKQMQKDIVPALRQLKNTITIEAICDKNSQAINKASFIFPGANFYKNYNNLFRRHPQLDFLILCLPHDQYFSIVKKALISKIPILKEKPMARTLSEGIYLCKLSQEYKTPVFILQQRRYSQSYETGKELLKSIEQPYMFEAKYSIPTGTIYKGWRADIKQAGGGVIIDMGYHIIDIIIWFFGLPEKINCAVSNKGIVGFKYSVEDSASLLFNFKNGLHGILQLACLGGPKQETFHVRGRNGSLEILQNQNQVIIIRNSFGKVLKSYTVTHDPIEETKKALLTFISKRKYVSNIKEHLKHMAFIEATYQSLKFNKGINPKILLKQY